MNKTDYTIESEAFISHGDACDAKLYKPKNTTGAVPLIIMAHGFGSEMSFGLHPFADAFASANIAVLMFDYRGFGKSEGEPRQLVHPFKHLQHIASLSWYGLRDVTLAVTGHAPVYVPIAGRWDELAILNTAECYDGIMALGPDDALVNECAARIAFLLPLYRPIQNIHKINAPTLLVNAKLDTLFPGHIVYQAAEKIKNSKLVEFECGHFEPYVGEFFEKTIAVQLDFFREHLLGQPNPKNNVGFSKSKKNEKMTSGQYVRS